MKQPVPERVIRPFERVSPERSLAGGGDPVVSGNTVPGACMPEACPVAVVPRDARQRFIRP